MITIAARNELSAELVNSIHAFRQEIFVGRLGWSLPMIDGLERDEYDTEDAVYVVAKDGDDHITACARLLQTQTRCMLTDLFAELLGGKPAPKDPVIWELSRLATSVRKSGEGRVLSFSQPTLDLLAAILDYTRRHGVKRLVVVTSVAIERLLLRSGFNVHRYAAPARIGDSLCVALFIEVPEKAEDDPGVETPVTYQQEPAETH